MRRSKDKTVRSSVFDYFADEGGLDSLHPGGAELTLRCLGSQTLESEARVLDLACGPGAGLTGLAEVVGCRFFGVELSARMIALARGRAFARGVGGRTFFIVGDVSCIPFSDDSFDAVLMECTLSTTPDKEATLEEMVRVTRPGGWVAIHDMAWPATMLGSERAFLGPLIKANPETVEGWIRLFGRAGLLNLETWDETAALRRFVDETEKALSWGKRLSMVWSAYREAGIAGLRDLSRFARVYVRTVREGRLDYLAIRGQKQGQTSVPDGSIARGTAL